MEHGEEEGGGGEEGKGRGREEEEEREELGILFPTTYRQTFYNG